MLCDAILMLCRVSSDGWKKAPCSDMHTRDILPQRVNLTTCVSDNL